MKTLERKLKTIEQSNNGVFNSYWLDNDTFVLYFNSLNNELKSIFPDLINEGEFCDFYAEYHEDEHLIVYILEFDDENIDVSDKISSLYLDYFVLKMASLY